MYYEVSFLENDVLKTIELMGVTSVSEDAQAFQEIFLQIPTWSICQCMAEKAGTIYCYNGRIKRNCGKD